MLKQNRQKKYVVVGQFSDSHQAAEAITAMRKDFGDAAVEYYSPYPDHHLEDAQYKGRVRSPVRMFTLLGGITGCLGAFLFTTWMSLDYPLRVSAKPYVSIPSFVVIAYECTILLGGIFTFLSMMHFCRIPNLFFTPGYFRKFTEGTFGVSVRAEAEESEAVRTKMLSLGAEEAEVIYAV